MMELKIDEEYWIKAKFKRLNDFNEYPFWFEAVDALDGMMMLKNVSDVKEAIPERKKVVIPKFVADWIEACKRDGDTLAFVLEGDYGTAEWLEMEGNEELLARAYLDGYEIEKEPLYTVEIPDPYGEFENVVLYKNGSGNVSIDRLNFNNWKTKNQYKLTEEEIKRNHEWAWQFAVPVEEE